MSTLNKSLLAMAIGCALVVSQSLAQQPRLGAPINPAELAEVDLIVQSDGSGLPAGSGSALQGKAVYERRCQACHGSNGEGANPSLQLVGGSMQSEGTPIRTVGSYWPYATTVFDYVRRAMPADAPKSLTVDEVYQVTAYLLYLNGIIAEDHVLDSRSLPAVQMPNRDGFIDRSTVH
ncbi:MAG: hypothetical protein RLZZ385_563 [Pseudomonadota bacterium]|jgi:cytochrome c